MHVHLISGFLGSGKTTAILEACTYLKQQGKKVAVITNDQGTKLVDSAVFSREGIPGDQVLEGCFCCRYDDLEKSIHQLMNLFSPDIILAEAVGSCTDMIATVIKPLVSRSGNEVDTVGFTCFADVRLLAMMLQGDKAPFDRDVQYIFFKQLEEATAIVVNKTDVGDPQQLLDVKAEMEKRYPGKPLYQQSSRQPATMQQWLEALGNSMYRVMELPSLEVDYDTYGAGEAKMAYLDLELAVNAQHNNAVSAGIRLLDTIADRCTEKKWNIGHLKSWSDLQGKYSYSFGDTNAASMLASHETGYQVLLINARVETDTVSLNAIVAAAIQQVANEENVRFETVYNKLYQPGYPEPRHRMA